MAHHQAGRLGQARKLYEEVLKRQPRHFDALHLLGVLAAQTRNPAQAEALIGKALAADPANRAAFAAHVNRGLARRELAQLYGALDSLSRAISLKPDCADAHAYRADILQELRQYEAAIAGYDMAIALGSGLAGVVGSRLHAKMRVCDWRDWRNELSALTARVTDNRRGYDPFVVLTVTDSAALQRAAAAIWVREVNPPNGALGGLPIRERGEHIRIAYFSSDLHDHATLRLAAGLFESHDRSKFLTTVFSFGPDSRDGMRRRLEAACEDFVDVRGLADRDVALLARRRRIDIAIDLKGFTRDNRAGIFALRAAPVQVSFLGYPGTMAAGYIDYLVADATVIPEDQRRHYAEKIITLPNCYQVNDSRRAASPRRFTRTELGLPALGFVYCCFNACYKITPEVFDGWMRILKAVPHSVLWLLEENPRAADRLRGAAVERGVAAQRLIFSKRVSSEEHLARQRCADLFLDTYPCNAHTTASDALWAGVPLLTRLGASFAGRVAASLLTTMGLPDLVTQTQDAYEALAIRLAADGELLGDLRARLEANRTTGPLFDTALFTRHLEEAFRRIDERRRAALPAEHVIVRA